MSSSPRMRKFFRRIGHSIAKRALWAPRRLLYAFKGYLELGGLRLPLFDFSRHSRSLLLKGAYEQAEIDFVRKYLRPGAHVVELGASIGVVSCHILRTAPTSLLSFEAVGAWASLARKTVGLNFKDPPYVLKEMAIGRVGQKEALFAFDLRENLGGRSLDGRGEESKHGVIRVPAMSLGEINAIHRVPADAWLVMDIEGTEWELVRNQGDALRRYEGIIVECHEVADEGGHASPGDVLDGFRNCGFILVDCVEHHTHLVACLRRIPR